MQDIERNYTGTNFVVTTLAVLVVISLLAWGIVTFADIRANGDVPPTTDMAPVTVAH